jgi:KDO2-lipid IV(A) lauroyltransferase
MIKNKSAALAFFIFRQLSLVLPQSVKFALAKALAYLFYKLHKGYYKRAKTNLDFIYADTLNREQIQKLIKDMFLNLALNFGSFLENQGISKERLLKKVTFKNDKIFIDALNADKPIVFITAHHGNWEILPLAIAAKYTPLVGVGRPLKQKWLDNILKKNREQFGIEMIEKNGAMRQMVKCVKSKKPLGLLVDQSLEGVEVEFMGKRASHTTSAALLAYKYGASVIPCFIKRVGFEKYEATFFDPIDVDKSLNMDEYILQHTQKQAKITQEFINTSPAQWLWIHRRWKREYPQIYKG